MTPERWRHIERLYHSALERDADERAAFLAEACDGDNALRGEVESLLRCDARAGRFIESPALEATAKLCAEDRVQSMTGRQIGPYQILSLLGAGGMGEVHLALDPRLGRKVAVKLLLDEFTTDAERVLRFEQEARAASALNHPNIITVYEIAEIEGRRFIVT
jgi:serine/threonine protein kinase